MQPLPHNNICVDLVEQYEDLQARLDALRQMAETAAGEDSGCVSIQPKDRIRLADLRNKLNQFCPAYPSLRGTTMH